MRVSDVANSEPPVVDAWVEQMVSMVSPDPVCMTCHNPATLLILHECGAPGGPGCERCWRSHQDFMSASMSMAVETTGDYGTCHHCEGLVTIDHVFAVPLGGA